MAPLLLLLMCPAAEPSLAPASNPVVTADAVDVAEGSLVQTAFETVAPPTAARTLPDRPRLVPRATVAADGQVIAEAGVQYVDFGTTSVDWFDVTEHTQVAPSALLRYGLTETIELRAGMQHLATSITFDEWFDASADATFVLLGGKWLAAQNGDRSARLSVLAEAGLLATEHNNAFAGQAVALAEADLTDVWTLGGGAGVFGVGESEITDSGAEAILSIAIERRIGRGAVFAEVADVPLGRSFGQLAGLIPLGDSMLLDLHGGVAGYTESFDGDTIDSTGGFVGVGLSWLR